MRGRPIDRAAVHRTIWNARDRHNRVKIHQKKFAESLGVSAPQMSRVIKEFVEQGRLKKIASRHLNVGVYVVTDPAEFDEGVPTGIGPPNG